VGRVTLKTGSGQVDLTRPISFSFFSLAATPFLSLSHGFFFSLTETPWPRIKARASFATTHHQRLHQQWRRILAFSPSAVFPFSISFSHSALNGEFGDYVSR
jgi:hypothetical protein